MLNNNNDDNYKKDDNNDNKTMNIYKYSIRKCFFFIYIFFIRNKPLSGLPYAGFWSMKSVATRRGNDFVAYLLKYPSDDLTNGHQSVAWPAEEAVVHSWSIHQGIGFRTVQHIWAIDQ